MRVEAVSGQPTLRVRVRDPAAAGTGKPRGVAGVMLYSAVGEEPPAELSGWLFHRCASRTRVDLALPAGLPPGSKVWVTAQWFNPTGQRGPAARPAYTRIAGGWAMAA